MEGFQRKLEGFWWKALFVWGARKGLGVGYAFFLGSVRPHQVRLGKQFLLKKKNSDPRLRTCR